jgi:hypothetical protein
MYAPSYYHIVSSYYYTCVIINAGVDFLQRYVQALVLLCVRILLILLCVSSYRPALCAAIRASASTAGIRVQRYKKRLKKEKRKKREP